MTASLDFTSIGLCTGGNHLEIEAVLSLDGLLKPRSFSIDLDKLSQPLSDEDIEAFILVYLRIMRLQNPANIRTAILNKVVNLDA